MWCLPLLKLNIKKCKVVSYGHHIAIKNEYYLHSNGSISVLEHLDNIKDLGVTCDSKLKFGHHINETVNKSYSVLGLIYRNFKYMSSDTFVMLYKTLVRSHLEYASGLHVDKWISKKLKKSRWERPEWYNNWRITLVRLD